MGIGRRGIASRAAHCLFTMYSCICVCVRASAGTIGFRCVVDAAQPQPPPPKPTPKTCPTGLCVELLNGTQSPCNSSAWLTDIDFYNGHQLGSTKAANPADCCSKCSAKTGCKFWSYQGPKHLCWMKTDSNGARPEAGTTSGPVSGSANGPIDLSAVGTLDWAHWGNTQASASPENRKSMADDPHRAVGLIPDVVLLNPRSLQQFQNAIQTFLWSDGVPNPPNAQPDVCGHTPGRKDDRVNSGIYTGPSAPNATFGFNLTMAVPLAGQQYDLYLYLGAYSVTGSLLVTLSDGSSLPIRRQLAASRGSSSEAVFQLTFKAKAETALHITWSSTTSDMSGDPNLTLEAAALRITPSAE